MIGFFRQAFDAVRGRGDAAATVPPMDGALRPNTLLQSAQVVLRSDAPDNLVACDGETFFSSGQTVFQLEANSGAAQPLQHFDGAVSCLAANGAGLFAAGLADGSLHVWGSGQESRTIPSPAGGKAACPTALLFGDPATLIICHGSAQNRPDSWKQDLMQNGASGSVWSISLGGGAGRQLADGLAYPYGLALAQGQLIVSESWRHRLVRIEGGAAIPVLRDLPGYPARISPAADGGFWLCVFAPRSQLIEFVLREKAFRSRMMAEIDPAHWVAPSLSHAQDFLEPMQGGALKSHGILKPWAPTRSYGLVIRLNAQFQPIASYHSRADGTHHGVTSCIEAGARLLVASKGGDAILALPLDGVAKELVA